MNLRSLRFRTVAVCGTSAALIAGAATVVTGARGENRSPQPLAQGESSFAVLARPATSQDQMPVVFREHPHPLLLDANLADARLAYTRNGQSYYVIPREAQGGSDLCLVHWAPSVPGGTDVACTTFESASNPDTPMSADGPGGAHGIVADNVTRVQTTNWKGEIEDAELVNNVYVAKDEPRGRAITLTTTDGKEHRFELPATPQNPIVDPTK
jgi:hypothetical protein